MDEFVRKGHEGVTFFVGPEIEQTPAFNKKTLFVVGLQDQQLIVKLAKEYNVKHIFLSANRSFDSIDLVNHRYMVGDTKAADWAKQIQFLLSLGYMVSLDYPAHKHVMVLKVLSKDIWDSRNFIPVLSVAIPNVSTSSTNLTIKIDDSNFKATNPGVWCMNHQEVTDSNRFTSWDEYGNDLVINVDTPTTSDFSEVKNQQDIGLDPDSKSLLKPEYEEEKIEAKSFIKSPESAAEAYAAGATRDPLSSKETTKKGKK